VDELWDRRRPGSHAGRGFRYQDAVATEIAIRAWRGELPLSRLIPEGHEDISLELDAHRLHLQVKSRRSHRRDFSVSELADAWHHLAELAVADPDAHVGLVLERPLPGAETGLEHTLKDAADNGVNIAVAKAVSSVVSPEEFLPRAHVLVMPTPETSVIALLAEKLDIPPATCVAHYEILRGRVAQLADENGVRSAADPAMLTVGDIARLLDDVSEAVDPSALNESVWAGSVELVDFTTPIEEPRFYNGVDVVAGHVVAGLPLERNELVTELEHGLTDGRAALAVGPSGSGKSALIWLTAFATRHRIRWYRVRHLREEDVLAVVRLVKGLRPTGASVGFVVDDLGRDDRAGFDALAEELRNYPEAVLLGACREEDLFMVRTAPGTAQVRPVLDERLAERIWEELRNSDETNWAEWREPYEASEGLLLEFGHLLTAGTRLAVTIETQVNRRVEERRDLELELLALVAAADAYGADLELARLRSVVRADDAALKAALVRLVDEHLISEHNGSLGGLHELRSRHITRAIHDVPPPTIADTAIRVIQLIEASALQPFLTRLLLDEVVTDDVVIDAIATRLECEPDPVAFAACLYALRLVGFRRMATNWAEIIAEEGAAPTDVGLIAHLVLNGGDSELFPMATQRSITRISDLDPVELRSPLITRIAKKIPAAVAEAPNVAVAATVLAALGEVGGSAAIEAASLARLPDGTALEDLRLLLEAAYAMSPDLASAVVEELGGSVTLLSRIERERPWVRNARLGVSAEGQPTAEAEYAYVAEAHQPKAHDAVVELARYLAAFAPLAEVIVCRAVDATGDTAGFADVPLADKAIDRRNLPSQAQIAWNRARGRAALAAVSAPTATAYASAAREIVQQATRLMRRVGEVWARHQRLGKQLLAETIALAQAAHNLAPMPIAIEASGPLEEGELPIADPVSFIGTMISNDLIPNLFQGNTVAPLIPTLVKEVDQLADPERWRLLREPPLSDLRSLKQTLLDLHAVLAERTYGNRTSAVALSKARKKGLIGAANVARRRAGARMDRVSDAAVKALGEAGYEARVIRREGEPESHRWPSDEFLVLLEIESIYSWQRQLPKIVELCRPLLKDHLGFVMAPVRQEQIVSSFAVKVIINIFPDDTVRQWPNLPLSLLDERVTAECRRCLDALTEISGVVASIRGSEVHDEEVAVLDAAMEQANKTLRFFHEIVEETNHPLLGEIEGTLSELAQQVENEAAALAAGAPVTNGVAASIITGLKGETNDIFGTYIGLITACVEYDVDPGCAWDRFQDALQV
jgi:hypothetical protein